jgi:hypothetical protein
MFLQTKFENKFCSSETILRIPLAQWESTDLGQLVKHAAEQQKYHQSLSPEDKAQILFINNYSHRKQRELLPPEKKVKILETDAAAHKKQFESLSPDDKSQILNKDADAHKKK